MPTAAAWACAASQASRVDGLLRSAKSVSSASVSGEADLRTGEETAGTGILVERQVLPGCAGTLKSRSSTGSPYDMNGKHPKAKATLSLIHCLLKLIEPLIMDYPSAPVRRQKYEKKPPIRPDGNARYSAPAQAPF